MRSRIQPIVEVISPQVQRYKLAAGRMLSWREMLSRWGEDEHCRQAFNQILADSPFQAFRWETPGITAADLDSTFEFVLIQALSLLVPADPGGYVQYFDEPGAGEERDQGVVWFPNLSNDGWLVVPSPREEFSAYGHLATFCRQAPAKQQDALWRIVAERAKAWLADRKLWLSTRGGGVDWLHVRLDSRPKYYAHQPYRRPSEA